MESLAAKSDIIQRLQKEVRSLQGISKSTIETRINSGLGVIENAFPEGCFPIGGIHEFLSAEAEDAAATNGFVSGLLGKLMQNKGACLWVSTKRTIFPPAIKLFGVDPERIFFVDLPTQQQALWAVEEALKCDALTAVIGEFSVLSFKESRRLQLATEQSRVTGFIHRYNAKKINTVACITRWKITPIASVAEEGMPGLGLPRWNVQLLKVRNGKPGTWQIAWGADGFQHIPFKTIAIPSIQKTKTG